MKKFIALLLTLIMVFTMLPSAALADDPPPTPYYTSTRNILGHQVKVEYYETDSGHRILVYYDGSDQPNETIEQSAPDIRSFGAFGEQWGKESSDPSRGEPMDMGLNDPARTNDGLGSLVSIPGLGNYFYIGSNSSSGFTANIYRKGSFNCFYGGEANYVSWNSGDTLGVILCALSFCVPAGEAFALVAATLNAVNATFTGYTIAARATANLLLDTIYFIYDYAIILPDQTVVQYQRRDRYYYINKAGDRDYYELKDRDILVLSDGSWYPDGHLNYINDAAFGLLLSFGTYGNHVETYTDDNDCYCNFCDTPRHIYDSCTDIDCNRCGAIRVPESHDFVWIPVEIWGGSPYIFRGYGHEQRCIKCGTIQHRELHHTQYWSNDTQTPYEIGFCEDCGAQMQQAHSFYSYWADPDLAYICAHGGMLVTECEHNCGYVNFEDVPAGHIYSNNCDEICDRCLQKTRTVPHSYANCEATTCSLCGYVRPTVPGHFYVHMPWIIEGTEDICRKQLVSCSNCSSEYWEYDHSHTWTDCEDAYCNDCGFQRTPPGHAMSTPLWESVGESGLCRVFKNHCTRDGCTYTQIVSTDTTHSYSPECTDTTCNDCGFVRPTVPGHSYLNCVDTTCEVCGATRTAPGHHYVTMPWVTVGTSGTCKKQLFACSNCSDEYWVYDTSHTWSDDCTDEYCNDCGYHRAAPGHAMSTPLWVAVGQPSVCKIYTNYCTRPGCSYTQIVSTDASHSYSPECTDTTCNECGYVRTAPGHSYTYRWVNVSTSGTCQKRVGTCSVCGDSYVSSYDYSHTYNSWTSISSSQHRHACTTCGYVQDAPHTFSSWTYSTSSVHKHTCSGCGYAQTQSHTWTYVGGGVYRCSVCGGNKVG